MIRRLYFINTRLSWMPAKKLAGRVDARTGQKDHHRDELRAAVCGLQKFPETNSWCVARPGDGGPIIGYIERRLTAPYFEGFDFCRASIGVFETRAAAAIALQSGAERS